MSQKQPKLGRLLARLPSLAEILRGSLLHRTTFHSGGCSKCASGRGHPQWVLNVNYPGGRQVPTALYKEALALVELKQMKVAQARLQYLVDNFPQSEEAPLARERLKSLGE